MKSIQLEQKLSILFTPAVTASRIIITFISILEICRMNRMILRNKGNQPEQLKALYAHSKAAENNATLKQVTAADATDQRDKNRLCPV